MTKVLRVAAFQMDIVWENPQANLAKVERWVAEADADLVVLPEMFATGFSMSPSEIAQPMNGEIVTRLTKLAIESGKAIITSVAIELDSTTGRDAKEGYVNRLFFFSPDGVYMTYDKRHTFRMGGEHLKYEHGERRLIVHYKGFRICPMVCYDLRFPVWSRNRGDYDVLIYIACWPDVRSYAWSTLLKARAIENLSYCIGTNRSGDEPKNRYSGDSAILDFMGKPLVEATPYAEQMVTAELSLMELDKFRTKFPAHLDADNFKIEPNFQ